MDKHVIGLRQDANNFYVNTPYKPDAPVNGGGFFQNVARALRAVNTRPYETKGDAIIRALGWTDHVATPWVSGEPEPSDHKIPVIDVDRQRVYLTEDGTPATLICSWSFDEFEAKYAS